MKKKINENELYELLARIPRGKVVTYGYLAQKLGNPQWARSVGNALHKNPDKDKYPCYRVVNSRGKLSAAYAFGGIEAQKAGLENDGIVVENFRVDLKKYHTDTL